MLDSVVPVWSVPFVSLIAWYADACVIADNSAPVRLNLSGISVGISVTVGFVIARRATFLASRISVPIFFLPNHCSAVLADLLHRRAALGESNHSFCSSVGSSVVNVLMCRGAKPGVFWMAIMRAVISAACLGCGAIRTARLIVCSSLSNLIPQPVRGSLFFLLDCAVSMYASVTFAPFGGR